MRTAELPPLQLQATAGRPLLIALESLPGGGWLWQAPPAPPGCSLAEAPSVPAGAGTGGPAEQRFVLTCAAPGTLTLRFERKRPWEAGVQAAQSVQVEVR